MKILAKITIQSNVLGLVQLWRETNYTGGGGVKSDEHLNVINMIKYNYYKNISYLPW